MSTTHSPNQENAKVGLIRPAINVFTENIEVDGKTVIVVQVNGGINKPYCNNDGMFWVKSGSDKRKVASPEDFQ